MHIRKGNAAIRASEAVQGHLPDRSLAAGVHIADKVDRVEVVVGVDTGPLAVAEDQIGQAVLGERVLDPVEFGHERELVSGRLARA